MARHAASTVSVSTGQPVSPSTTDGDRHLLRRGGRAGLAGSAAMLGAFVVVGVVAPPSVSEVESLTTYPDIATGRILENSLYLAALVLWAVQFVAMGRALVDRAIGRPPLSPWIAAFGLVPMAAGALIHISTSLLSDRYTAADATAADRAMIEAGWAAAQSMFDAFLITGAVIVPMAVVALSRALIRSTAVGPVFGRVVLGLGLAGSIGGVVAVVDPTSAPGVAGSILTTLVAQTLIGWRLVRA